MVRGRLAEVGGTYSICYTDTDEESEVAKVGAETMYIALAEQKATHSNGSDIARYEKQFAEGKPGTSGFGKLLGGQGCTVGGRFNVLFGTHVHEKPRVQHSMPCFLLSAMELSRQSSPFRVVA